VAVDFSYVDPLKGEERTVAGSGSLP